MSIVEKRHFRLNIKFARLNNKIVLYNFNWLKLVEAVKIITNFVVNEMLISIMYSNHGILCVLYAIGFGAHLESSVERRRISVPGAACGHERH